MPGDTGPPGAGHEETRVANGSGTPVEIVDTIGVLHAHGLIDLEAVMTLRLVATWLKRVRRARGLSNASPDGLWEAIVSGQAGAKRWTAPITEPNRRTPGDQAWWRLVQIHNHFAELRQLDQLALVMRIAAGDHCPANRSELLELQVRTQQIAELMRRGKRRTRIGLHDSATSAAGKGNFSR